MEINNVNSRTDKSVGILTLNVLEKPNITFIHDRKKNVGPSKYKNSKINKVNRGKRSKKKLKNKNSETKKIEPGNPKKIKLFKSVIRNNLGHKKLRPLISVKSLVLNLRAMASTSKNEFVDNNAWAIIIQKLASIKFD
jgi:hypothetical protein